MNKKLKRVLDEIRKAEGKLAVWQERLDELNVQREFLENEEIVKSIRAMKLDSYTLLETLTGIQNGTVSFMNSGDSGNCGEEDTESFVHDIASSGNDGEHTEAESVDNGEYYIVEDTEMEVSADMVDMEDGVGEEYLSEDWAEEQEDRSGK